MVEEALAAGVTTIDTADAYVGGVTEEMLFRLLKARRRHPGLQGRHASLGPRL